MDSCNGLKRLFELESCASGQQEGSQNEANRVEAKRQRTALESNEDSFDEFVALMNRIQYMKTNNMNFSSSEEISIQEELDVKVIRTKLPGLPSFEWEDFCVPSQMDISSFHSKHDPISSQAKGKQAGVRPANCFKTDSSSHAYDKRPAEGFDLNVEASSNIRTL